MQTRKATLLRKVRTDIGHRRTSDRRAREEKRRLSESEREKEREKEGSRCIDRRHKIHFMTWTLSSDWCISRRIASQIKRSSTLESPLTTSPGSRRRWTMPSTLVCISHPFSLFIYMSLSLDTRRQVYRQKLTSWTVLLHGLIPLRGFANLFACDPQ